jgi:hypothetical protein
MTRIISIHEYALKPGIDAAAFERALRAAEGRGLFDLPGLLDYRFVRGIKGRRRNGYATIWVYESREAWGRLWGSPDQPRQPADYPARWQAWENEILAPLLAEAPDAIAFTAYEEF